ncbi:MAG: hypothetical protein ACI85I_002495 [Arenicella sp.]|jgi:hypothetical protein
MGNAGIAKQLIAFVLYVLLQIMFGKNMTLGKYAFCFPYLAFLLAIPFDISRIGYMAIAFLMGFSIDIAYDTIGFHASACVFVAFSRQYILNFIAPSGGYESDMKPTFQIMGAQWFIVYSVALIFIHHTIFFLIETSNFAMFQIIIFKILASTFFTFVLVLILQAFYIRAKRRR